MFKQRQPLPESLPVEPDGKQIGARIREARTKVGLTQERMGELVGVKGHTVWCWQAGRMKPNHEHLLELALHGETSTDWLLGREVQPWPLRVLKEMRVGDVICVARRLDPDWRRWVTAHAIGHLLLHPGNHVWIRLSTSLAERYEREAEDFAHALLVDPREAAGAGLAQSWEVADYFGVPDEVLRV